MRWQGAAWMLVANALWKSRSGFIMYVLLTTCPLLRSSASSQSHPLHPCSARILPCSACNLATPALQLCVRNMFIPEAIKQAGMAAVSVSAGSPVTWAVARYATMAFMACCVTATSELKTRHLFLVQRAVQPPGTAGGVAEGGPAGSKPKSA